MVAQTKVGTTHVIAQCRDCAWRSEDYRSAEGKARRHAEQLNHTVHVERGQAWLFNPRPEDYRRQG